MKSSEEIADRAARDRAEDRYCDIARSTKLLIPSRPLELIPELAVLIGLNEAIVLQQLHYWLEKSRHEHSNQKWIYNTVDEWQAQFPFWCAKTIQRTVRSLVNQKLVRIRKFNKQNWDRTNWYTIDYGEVAKLERPGQKLFVERETKRIKIAFKRRRRFGQFVRLREDRPTASYKYRD